MKALLAAPAAAVVAVLGVAPAGADPGADVANPGGPLYSPPFVAHTSWIPAGGLTSLRVYPTASGRAAARQFDAVGDAEEAWTEVLALSPEADTPGMRAQFLCHWLFAEIAEPGKASWNLEPWRPVVDGSEMLASGCNPGGPEEAEFPDESALPAPGGGRR
ncbi:hypothetical protein MB901379_00685 [Mycobacterium basiliense]|uniref:DUF2599 domain-containing protein n=1 Tax=Mycobacterium basiliense TaxID=2094119 RepID=A0A3S4BT62_9MYCO|nr:DUF2599 domain-containing protein [Mycobacterium basiliense]VDM87150.1 hypothetical protein MB901379_00685 [Mycobacterium basiliense]